MLDGSTGRVAHSTTQFALRQDSRRHSRAGLALTGLAVSPADSCVFALCASQALVVCRAHWMKNAEVRPLARLSFGDTEAAAQLSQPGAAAVQVAFSRTHPEHLYCSDPSSPGTLLLLDYANQAVVKTIVVPVEGGAAITALALDPAERLLAAGTSSGTVLLLRLESEAWAELAAHAAEASVVGLAFSDCGSELFSAAGSATFVWQLTA